MGVFNGFPWEHIIATSRAKKYVIEKYQFTPIKAKYHLSIVDGSQRVSLHNKEFDISFSVYVGRILQINEMTDDYLENLSRYYLTKDLDEYIKEKTDDKGIAYASLFAGRISDRFTLSELEKNPQIIFEELKDCYWCRIILYDNISKKNYKKLYSKNPKIA